MNKEETDKLFNTITSNGCREMTPDRFHQAVNELEAKVKPACETLQKRFDIYAKAINQIDDFFEYQYINHHQDDIKRRVMEIIDNITKQLSKSV